MDTPPEMRTMKVILFASLCMQLVHGQTYECANEKDGELEFCVFRDVRFFKNTTNIAFSFPTDATKPVNIAFKDSHMVAIPGRFLEVFGEDLKVLKVEDCKLQSVTFTRNMEALYARNNFISTVLRDRSFGCENLVELDLSSNRLNTVANVTNCVKLKVLNLSGNEELVSGNTIDLSAFQRLTLLEDLNLSDTGLYYLDNRKKAKLPSLKQLDLSKNDLLPSDLRIDVFKPFDALETLKLSDNNMRQLDYAELTDLKSLKRVYLNGNNFPCHKVKDMIEFLNNQHNIATPLERHTNCEEREFEGMCCTGPLAPPPPRPQPPPEPQPQPPVTAPPSPRPTPMTPTPRADDSGEPVTTKPAGADADDGGSAWQIVVAVIVVIVLVAAGAGYFVYKKRYTRVHQPQ